jgi:hypothetical protein
VTDPHYEKQVGKTYEQVMVEMMEKTEALERRVQCLEKALRDVALMPCDCFRNSGCGSCSARESLKAMEA